MPEGGPRLHVDEIVDAFRHEIVPIRTFVSNNLTLIQAIINLIDYNDNPNSLLEIQDAASQLEAAITKYMAGASSGHRVGDPHRRRHYEALKISTKRLASPGTGPIDIDQNKNIFVGLVRPFIESAPPPRTPQAQQKEVEIEHKFGHEKIKDKYDELDKKITEIEKDLKNKPDKSYFNLIWQIISAFLFVMFGSYMYIQSDVVKNKDLATSTKQQLEAIFSNPEALPAKAEKWVKAIVTETLGEKKEKTNAKFDETKEKVELLTAQLQDITSFEALSFLPYHEIMGKRLKILRVPGNTGFREGAGKGTPPITLSRMEKTNIFPIYLRFMTTISEAEQANLHNMLMNTTLHFKVRGSRGPYRMGKVKGVNFVPVKDHKNLIASLDQPYFEYITGQKVDPEEGAVFPVELWFMCDYRTATLIKEASNSKKDSTPKSE